MEVMIPNDVIYQILGNLQVKSLLRFKCVCKSWNAIISTPEFAKYHLHSSPNHSRLIVIPIFNYKHSNDPLEYSLDSVFRCSYFAGANPTRRPLPIGSSSNPCIIGSCHGIIVISNPPTLPLLWNPCTGESKRVLPIENSRALTFQWFSFGYDTITDTYKMVLHHSTNRNHQKVFTKVHTFGTDHWREIQCFPARPTYGHRTGMYLNGTLNWLATSASNSTPGPHILVSLDLGTEEYQELRLPPSYVAGFEATNLGVSKGCLCMIAGYRLGSTVWIMKDYGNDGSWSKLIEVPYLGDYPQIRGDQTNRIGKAVFVSDDDEVLLEMQDENKLIVYNSRRRSIRTVGTQTYKGCIHSEVFVESLLSPSNL